MPETENKTLDDCFVKEADLLNITKSIIAAFTTPLQILPNCLGATAGYSASMKFDEQTGKKLMEYYIVIKNETKVPGATMETRYGIRFDFKNFKIITESIDTEEEQKKLYEALKPYIIKKSEAQISYLGKSELPKPAGSHLGESELPLPPGSKLGKESL